MTETIAENFSSNTPNDQCEVAKLALLKRSSLKANVDYMKLKKKINVAVKFHGD